MPARLYACEYPDFLASLDRLVDFAAQRPVTRVLRGRYRHDDFIIWNGGQRLPWMLGESVRLALYNRTARRHAAG